MDKKYIGKILRHERLKKNLSQQEIADLLYMGRNSYAHYERGTNAITIDNLKALAEFYQCSTDYLLGRYQVKELGGYKDGKRVFRSPRLR